MANITLGKVAPTPKGEWNGSLIYEKLDIVTNNTTHKVYMAIQNVPANTAITNNEYWEILGIQSSDAEIDDTAGDGDINKVWSADKSYQDHVELADIRVGVDGTIYDSAGTAVRTQITKLKNSTDESIDEIKSSINYKTDNVYGGETTEASVNIINGKTWGEATGTMVNNIKRGASNPILVTPDMKNVTVASGYVMLIFGNNDGYGYTLNLIQTYTPNAIAIEGNVSYKYIYIIVARSDVGVITGDDLTNVIKINKYQELIPYLTEHDIPAIPENLDYYFVKDGKLVCYNQPVTSGNNVAKYARVDMGSNIKKVRCKFTQRGGGNITLISTPLDTDNHVQNIVNKSIHCTFGLYNVSVQTFLNTTATTIASFTYNIISDDTTEYEIGFEYVDSTTFKVLTPDGTIHTVSHDFSDYIGRYFIFETFNNNMDASATPTINWNRASIVAVYCKPVSGHAFRDDFSNYIDGHQPEVSPSGHVYTLFRNISVSDSTYVNANGTNDA